MDDFWRFFRDAGLFLGAAGLLAYEFLDPCANTVVERLDSPNGRVSAVIFERSCGATTGFSTQISVIPSWRRLSGSGTVFRADSDHHTASAAAWGGPWAEVEWADTDHLIIRYDQRSRLFAREDEVRKVAVTYRPMLPPTETGSRNEED